MKIVSFSECGQCCPGNPGCGTVTANAQSNEDAPPAPPMHHHGKGMGMESHTMGFFAKQLNLTDDQKTQMKAIMQKEHPTMKPLFQQTAADRSTASPVCRRTLRSSQGPSLSHSEGPGPGSIDRSRDAHSQPALSTAHARPTVAVEADAGKARGTHAEAHGSSSPGCSRAVIFCAWTSLRVTESAINGARASRRLAPPEDRR